MCGKQLNTDNLTREEADDEIVSISIQMKHPSVGEIQGRNRTEKYDFLTRSANRRRDELVVWITERGWMHDVYRLSEPNAFGLLFANCTRQVANHLCDAPGVVDVTPAKSFEAGISPFPPAGPVRHRQMRASAAD